MFYSSYLLFGLFPAALVPWWLSRVAKKINGGFAAVIFGTYAICMLLGVIRLNYGTLDQDVINKMDARSQVAKICHNDGRSTCW